MLPWSWRLPVRGAAAARRAAALPRSSCSRTACSATRSGVLHVVLLATSIALVGEGWVYQAALAAQAAWLALAAAGRLRLRVPGAGIAYYYLLMTAATMAALVRYLR